jgi:hypothetical protein
MLSLTDDGDGDAEAAGTGVLIPDDDDGDEDTAGTGVGPSHETPALHGRVPPKSPELAGHGSPAPTWD